MNTCEDSRLNQNKNYLAERPFSAESKTSGVLSVPCGMALDMSSMYFSSGDLSSSESKSSFCKQNTSINMRTDSSVLMERNNLN